MKEKHPKFIAQLEQHGVTYTTVVGNMDNPSMANGSGWKSIYMTNDKKVAEERFIYIYIYIYVEILIILIDV